MKKTILLIFLCWAGLSFAQGTRTWKQDSFDDFEKGTAKGVAIRSDGVLELAPAFKAVYTSPSTYIWALAADGSGAVYAAAGSPARVYRIAPDGKATVIFEPQELQVQALAVDSNGLIYAATSPDGKVYRIERAGAAKSAAPAADHETSTPVDASYKSSVFYDPKTKYIWDLALDGQGQLYIATGDRGEIYRVNRSGEGSLFFKSDEAHIRVLAFDRKGNVIAGSDGSGLVYRIAPSGEAFVLYSAPKKEITALAVDAAGNIYATGVGEKRGGPPAPMAVAAPSQPQPAQSAPQPPAGTASAPPGPSSGSEIYRIAPDGAPRRIWTSRDDIVYALGFNERGQLLAGTGNKGRIYLVDSESRFTDLLKASATQVTAFAKGPGGLLYASTSNLGKLFSVGTAPEAEGTYESDVFDARNFSRWGRVEVRGAGRYEIELRSGNVDNPDRNWSPWKRVNPETGEAGVPAARFIQWRAVLRPGERPSTVDSVLLNYRANNVAPVLDDVTVLVGYRYQPVPKPPETLPAGGPRFIPIPAAVRDRDSVAVRWTAHDDNDDELLYSLYYRGDGETRWKLLKDKISDAYFTLDSGLLPDGGYTVRIVASDSPVHPPDEALTDSRESARFEVDNTPPRVEDLHASAEGDQIHVTFRATDTFSPINRAEFSVDAQEWQFLEPVGKISDNRVENYDFVFPIPANAGPAAPGQLQGKKQPKTAPGEPPVEHVVVVRVYDRFDNMGAAKTVIVTPAR